jgi:undecaprenyl-diphosphatase
MTLPELLQSVFMGAVEAVTEFLPVSSTGHLILAGKLIGFQGPPGHVFEVAIQLGAVLAVCVLYFKRLLKVACGMTSDPRARHFAVVSVIAFIPAVIVGILFHHIIKTYLFKPWVVCFALVLGGIAILVIEKKRPLPRIHAIETMPYKTGLLIGLVQCLALIPGVSRSGATIMGALLVGVDRKTATEFSFFQAIPLIAGATLFDLWANRGDININGIETIAAGFITSFIGAMLVIRWMLSYVTHNGFGVFAWYRIIVGIAGLIALALIPSV